VAYWIARNNQKVGPYSLDDVQRMMADGKLVASDLAWTDGLPNWGPAFDVIPAPQTPELPPPPAPQPLAPTRMMPVMRTPPTPEWQSPDPQPQPAQQPAAPQPAPQQPAPQQPMVAPTAAVPTGQMRDFHAQPATAQPFSAQPVAAQPFAGQPDPAATTVNQPFQPAPPPQPSQFGAPAQPFQQNSPYIPQPIAAPPAQFPPPPPPPAQALPYQPYPGQPMQGQPTPGQPMPAQPMAYQAAGMQGALVPPGMHWALVLVLGYIVPLFSIIWMFIQASFVKRIDPSNPARKLFIVSLVLAFVSVGVGFGVAAALQSDGGTAAGVSLGLLGLLASVVCYVIAYFKMRTSLLNYYNTVEPIGLRLSGAMTFFFNTYYFQHHFHRIARWKQTGILEPQA